MYTENELVVAKERGCVGGMDWDFGVSRWINKVLLYSIGNYIQYPGINLNGKEY